MILSDSATRNAKERQLVLAAMTRIRDNTAERGYDAYTVVALAAESGVSRQRLYEQHSDLLNDFKATAGGGSGGPSTEAVHRQLAQAHERTKALLTENAQLRSKIRTLAAVITELTHDAGTANVSVSIPRNHLP
jgi:hypothetical protein